MSYHRNWGVKICLLIKYIIEVELFINRFSHTSLNEVHSIDYESFTYSNKIKSCGISCLIYFFLHISYFLTTVLLCFYCVDVIDFFISFIYCSNYDKEVVYTSVFMPLRRYSIFRLNL